MGTTSGGQKKLGFFQKLKSLLIRVNAPAQRRRSLRVPTPAHEVTCQHGRERIKGVLKDVSATGMRLLVGRPVRKEQMTSVRLDGNRAEYGTVQARVVWCRPNAGRYEIGVAVLDKTSIIERSWLQDTLNQAGAEAGSKDQRASRRVPLRKRATLRSVATEPPSAATVLDLSEGGALIQTTRIVDKGVYLSLRFDESAEQSGFDMEVRVVRVQLLPDDKYEVSLQFIAPTPNAAREVRALLDRATRTSQ